MREIVSANKRFYLMVGVAVALPGSLQAQGGQQAGQDPVAEVLSCGAQIDDQSRLACYDRLRDTYLIQASGKAPPLEEASVNTAVADPAAVSATADLVREREEAEFGVEHHQSNKSTSEMTSGVVRLERNALGGLVLTLENDQVWQQSDRSRIQIEVGDQVTISRGALSAFYLRVNAGQKRARFNRVR